MKVKHQELLISEEAPFQNCKLEREPYARILTDVVNTYADGFVLAISNEWGTGKTTFVKMWRQQLKNEGFETIYFNAWENDFDNAPLVAIMSELATLTNKGNKEVFKSVVTKGSILVKNIAPAVMKALVKRYIGDLGDVNLEAVENATKASSEILEQEIKEYTSKKKTIIDFRKELEKFVNQGQPKKPLVFIVDELDRCRPNYAIEVLEQIKHFFSVSGIVFVLSIDKKHLSSSVKGFYGSEQIDSEEYLRRFIDLEYSIPKPTTKAFINYLFDYYDFKAFFSAKERLQYNEHRNDQHNFLSFAEFLLTKSNSTLRQQERIFSLTRLVLCSFKLNEYTFSPLFFFLIYVKVMDGDLFGKIERNELTLQELSDCYGKILSSESLTLQTINISYVEALLIFFYNNNREYQNRDELLQRNEIGGIIDVVLSNVTKDKESLGSYFEDIEKRDYRSLSLSFLLKRITLTEPMEIQSPTI